MLFRSDIAACLEGREYGKALRAAMEFADRINQAFDAAKPWDMARHAEQRDALHAVCSVSLAGFHALTLWLKPILPALAARAEAFLGCAPLAWSDLDRPPARIGRYEHLMARVDAKQLDALFGLAQFPNVFVKIAINNILAAEKAGEGRKLFVRYCASCHGSDAKGGGPLAKNLKTPPPDLTRIPKVDGKFPTVRVEQVIQGEAMTTTHGTREMPVWGSVFRRQAGEGFAKLDIYNLKIGRAHV